MAYDFSLDKIVDKYMHEVEVKFIPGFFVSVIGFFIWFYPGFLTWKPSLLAILSNAFVDTLIIISIICIGICIHFFSKLFEKIFIEKLFNFDLKRIGKIQLIVGKAERIRLIDKYHLDTREATYFEHWKGSKTASEETWSKSIKKVKREITGAQGDLQKKYNRRNKLYQGIMFGCLVLFILWSVKYGFNFEYFFIDLILVVLFAMAMLGVEKRELEIIYSKL